LKKGGIAVFQFSAWTAKDGGQLIQKQILKIPIYFSILVN